MTVSRRRLIGRRDGFQRNVVRGGFISWRITLWQEHKAVTKESVELITTRNIRMVGM
jgi:hypothetical protein